MGNKQMLKQKGITLVALVITIIILLILAGISIAQLTGTGIFAKAKEAKAKYKNAEELENQTLAEYERMLNNLGGSSLSGSGGGDEQGDDPTPSGPNNPASNMTDAKKDDMFQKTVNSTIVDEYENQVVVPAGFKITEDSGSNVTKGIVIEDNQGNEFVWIPVGEITDINKEKHTITLSRYTFDENGNPTQQGNKVIDSYYRELSTSSYGNKTAKELEKFKTNAMTNHGYYIGRYEARKNNEGSKVTEKSTDTVWNNITQLEASMNCQSMYSNETFTSDLMNSYAWDTAIVFLQEFDNRENSKKSISYSIQTSLNDNLINTGTRGTDTEDKICNIYDMASNLREWATETYIDSNTPCTARGGCCELSDSFYTSIRDYGKYVGWEYVGFRPILYCSTES